MRVGPFIIARRYTYPYSAQALRERGPEFGVQTDSNLARVLADKQPERAITILLDDVEKNMRRDLKLAVVQAALDGLAAEREALARERERLAREVAALGQGTR